MLRGHVALVDANLTEVAQQVASLEESLQELLHALGEKRA